MNTSTNKAANKPATDPFEKLVFEEGIRIKDLRFYPEMDLMAVIFNNKTILKFNISDYPKLKNASDEDRNHWELENNGIAVTWETLDEDLSAVGFLKESTLQNFALGE